VTAFAPLFIPPELERAVSDQAWLAAMLEAERALVNAGAIAGVVPAHLAGPIAERCRPELYDVEALCRDGRAAGNPVEPLVRALRAQVGGEAAGYVHWGATSQDILDSAAMLVARDALRIVDDALSRAADACARHAEDYRDTVMAARTLLQQAVPTTFGAKAGSWLVGLLDARYTLERVGLWAQLGGAAGTLASFGDQGPEVLRLYAVELDLGEPQLPWHTIRTPIAWIAGALALTAGVAGKIARDIVLLAQTEVGEVSEGSGGESSAMPHKQNPMAAVLASACERHARASCGVLFESMVAEHERATGAWHAEWHALTTALAATGGAVDAVARSLESLQVDAQRMRDNIVPETLSEAESRGIDASQPEDYLGAAGVFVDRVLARYRS